MDISKQVRLAYSAPDPGFKKQLESMWWSECAARSLKEEPSSLSQTWLEVASHNHPTSPSLEVF